MTYYSFDPRSNIRCKIGTKKDYNHDDIDEYVISVVDNHNDTLYIPLLLPEETRSNEQYVMPYIEMVLVSSPVRPHNIDGDIRETEAYIDLNIWYTVQDNISMTTFGKTIADKIVDLVMTYRRSVTSVNWMEIMNDGIEMLEDTGSGMVFHRVVQMFAKNWG